MNFELLDFEGVEIAATMFGEEAIKKFTPILKENGVYLFSNGSVKMANKRFTSAKNDFCLTFDQNAVIEEVVDDKRIQNLVYSFTPIAEIESHVNQSKVDIIGVLIEVNPALNITMKNGQQKDKRNVTIADEGGKKVLLSLWGSAAHLYDY